MDYLRSNSNHRSPIVILGSTATGKSDLALHLAQELGGEIVNADASQMIRGFTIGTAKPSPAERSIVPHHLFDVLDPTERLSAGGFARRARSVVEEIESRGAVAILVGGSGLYLRALFEGLAKIPPVDPRLRSWLKEQVGIHGIEFFSQWLALLDPESNEKIASRDRQRRVRCLEVILDTGHRLSHWWAQPKDYSPFEATKIGLTIPRPVLYDRIDSRVERMLHQGWIDEVREIVDSGVPESAPAFQAIGYRQIFDYLRRDRTLASTVDEIVRATRAYAKRQRTWFRREENVHWLLAEDRELLRSEATQLVVPAP